MGNPLSTSDPRNSETTETAGPPLAAPGATRDDGDSGDQGGLRRRTPTADETKIFNLPAHSPKADPALIAADRQRLGQVAGALAESVALLERRLEDEKRKPGRHGQAALERDLEIHRIGARLRTIRRFGLDLCLGRMVGADGGEPVYVGRLSLADADERRLLIDWRSPAAAPFFAATHADPMGLASRRRYRWTKGRVTDYWDEVFTPEGLEGHAALDDQSAFIASLGASRSPRMRDVLATIQADQDAIIRAEAAGSLVVDGGPGTGKTVVALHRAAYLLYSDPRLGARRGGLLFVGPHQHYLDYVADVLPNLGEEGVAMCTLADLVPEGAGAPAERDPEVARLKSTADLVRAIDRAVGVYEEPPTKELVVETQWAKIRVTPKDWAEAYEAVEPGTPHNEAREQVWEALLAILIDLHSQVGDIPPALVRRSLLQDHNLVAAFSRAWPLLEPTDVVGDLWSVPAYLRLAAPWLAADDVARLQRSDAAAWTQSDLPLLDAARRRLGDPDSARRRTAAARASAEEREQRTQVIDDLIAAQDDFEGVEWMLLGDDLRDALASDPTDTGRDPDELAGPFAHIVVDEAQELTDAEWQMLLDRCPSRSFTVVGDRAQARHGFAESWEERLERVGLDRVRIASLSINYRTPEEVMAEAAPVILAALPDANVPTSVRSAGLPVRHGSVAELQGVLDSWLAEHVDGTACVVGAPWFLGTERVQSLTPETVKGLEFDLVVLVDPGLFGDGIEGAVDHYVSMTRTTHQLVVLTS